MIKNKGQLNISFGWIFAIVVGGFILFLAIYGITKFTGLQETQQSAETSRSIEVLLNPLETGFETSQKVVISAPTDTRIYLQCDTQGTFGRQKIKTQQKSFNSYTDDENTVSVVLENKYIFAEYPLEGKNFFAFSKPYEFPSERSYEFPFKVLDVVYLTSSEDNYCFINAPQDIETELLNLNQENLYTEKCPDNSLNVCYSRGNDCDIEVNYDKGIVSKNSGDIYFEGDALMYAGIFSDVDEYECNLDRIMKRAEQLAILYSEKVIVQQGQGCSSDIQGELISFEKALGNFNSSRDIFYIGEQARILNTLNSNRGDCKLW